MRSISRVASEHQPPMGYQSNIVFFAVNENEFSLLHNKFYN
jgi:hypothetical protein